MVLGRKDRDAGDVGELALGKRARDTITGFSGILTGKYDFLHACTRWTITGTDTTGRPCEHVVDEPQLELLSDEIVHPESAEPKTGGDRSGPARMGSPR